jgi:hypothetical protein
MKKGEIPVKHKCELCERMISHSNFSKHERSCEGPKPPKKIRGVDYDPNGGYKDGSRVSWNKGLTKETDDRIRKGGKKLSELLKAEYASGIRKQHPSNPEADKRLSVEQSLHNRGGKAKWYEVAGQKVQGTWERDIALKFEELGIKWYKPKVGKDVWIFTMGGKVRSYTPDFYLPEFDLYLEVKGYWWRDDKEKTYEATRQNKDKVLIILEKKEFEKIKNNQLDFLLTSLSSMAEPSADYGMTSVRF